MNAPHTVSNHDFREAAARPRVFRPAIAPFAVTVGLLLLFIASIPPARAQAALTGAVEGRVANASSGTFLGNARVIVDGTSLVTLTNRDGWYRIVGVPVGEVTIKASYAGMEEMIHRVQIASDQAARRDFDLEISGVVKMDAFTLEEMQASGQLLALNEKREAANIKEVVAADEFGSLGEPSLGEFIKMVPGITVDMAANNTRGVQVRGFPSANTLLMFDGVEIPSAGSVASRGVYLDPIQMANVDRVEVTKVPTPDLPANALGGAINTISNSGFDRRQRETTFRLYAMFNGETGEFDRRQGIIPALNVRGMQPALDISHVQPINDRLAIAVSGTLSTRYHQTFQTGVNWDRVRLVATGDNWNYTSDRHQRRISGAAKIDWKASKTDTLSFTLQMFDFDLLSSNADQASNFGAGATGDANNTQGAPTAVGSVSRAYANLCFEDDLTQVASLIYRHNGDVWRMFGQLSYSHSISLLGDIDKGFFGSVGHSIPNLILRGEGLGGRHPDVGFSKLTATTANGTPVNIFDANEYSINNASSFVWSPEAVKKEAKFDIGRDFRAGDQTFSLKTGAFVQEHIKDIRQWSRSWNFRPGASVAERKVSNYDVLLPHTYENTNYGGSPIIALSPQKAWDLYQKNPSWFVPNEAANYQSQVSGSQLFNERIMAAYLRGDLKLMDDRFWIVAGARYERTENDSLGLKDDQNAVYRKDANGNLLRDAAGALIPITTDPLERNKLRYTERGQRTQKTYDDYYPSLNASFDITDSLTLRFGYARTIGRPALNFIIPSITYPDPATQSANPTITVVNSGLKPWTSNGYDLALESSVIKGGYGSIAVFTKDIEDFFGVVTTQMTPEIMALYGLGSEYANYNVSTRTNIGSAEIDGIEFNYRQDFGTFHTLARGLQVYFNVTALHLTGPNTADFAQFCPRIINAGINYVRSKFALRVNWQERKPVRRTLIAPNATTLPNTFDWVPRRTTVGGSVEYQFTPRFAFVASVRNLFNAEDLIYRMSPETPQYARPQRNLQYGAEWTAGIQGKF